MIGPRGIEPTPTPPPQTQKRLGLGDLASDFRRCPGSRVEAVADPRPQPASYALAPACSAAL